jgi:WD40 repeat protein
VRHEPWKSFSSDGKTHNELKDISCISYFPDGKQMISGSWDKTNRRWDLWKGKENKNDREVSSMRKQWGYQEMADGLSLLVLGGIVTQRG